MMLTTKSKVTRNSSNEALLRGECERVAKAGGAFEIKEYYGGDCWWTEFTIHTPVCAEEQP